MSNKNTLEANITVHSALANAGEYDKSPHFREENKAKVFNVLKNLISKTPSKDKTIALDMGCGTGFILHMLSPIVEHVHGVDITDDMMKHVDLSMGNISLKNSVAEKTGFDSDSFDLVTAYSFLDHLEDYKKVLEEAFRVLKAGGIFYSDLNPNRDFAYLMKDIESSHPNDQELSFSISREIKGMLHNGAYYEENFGIDEDVLIQAEPQKSYKNGFEFNEVKEAAYSIGFKEVNIEFDWFLGQGVLMNSDTSVDLSTINTYLQEMLPATKHLYKYLRFVFVK